MSNSSARSVHDVTVVILDLETTGLHPEEGDRVLEVATVRLETTMVRDEEGNESLQVGQVTDEFTTLVNPGVPVQASEIHRITQAEIDRAPAFAEVADAITARLQGCLVVGHNVTFDLGFLKSEYSHSGLEFLPVHHACTREGARELLAAKDGKPGLSTFRLGDCCDYLNIPLGELWHAALADTRATAQLWLRLIEKAQAGGFGFVPDLGNPWYDTAVATPLLPSAPVVLRDGMELPELVTT